MKFKDILNKRLRSNYPLIRIINLILFANFNKTFFYPSFRHWGIYGGSTGLLSSSTDIAKWMLMQLNDGKNENGDVVIKSADLAQTHSPQTAIRSSTVEKNFHKPKAPFTVTETSYAFGWKNGFYKGTILIQISLKKI